MEDVGLCEECESTLFSSMEPKGIYLCFHRAKTMEPFVPLLVFTCRGCLKSTHIKVGDWKHNRVI